MKISDSARLRLALALVILRHKPRNQSCAGYLLDVRARFPIQDHGCDASQSTSQDPWRERALLLEVEIRNLKRKAAMDCSELEALRTIIPTPTQTTGPEETPGTGASKKKKKKSDSVNRSNANPATQATNHLSELQAALSRITADRDVLPLLDPCNVFMGYQRLLLVSAKDIRPYNCFPHLFSSATSLLKRLGELLQTTVQLHNSVPKNPVEVINTMNTVLGSVTAFMIDSAIDTVLSSGPSEHIELERCLEEFLSSLALDILLPLMKSFVHLSQNTLFFMLQGTKISRKKTARTDPLRMNSQAFSDVRPALLALYKQLLSKLRDGNAKLLPRIGEILDLVALSAVTEISKLWTIDGKARYSLSDSQDQLTTTSTNNITPNEGTDDRPERDTRLTRDGRIHRLARKEALWYLTAIAHDALRSTSGAVREVSPNSTGRTELLTLVQEQIASVLSGLLVRCTNEMYHEEESSFSKRNGNHHGHMDGMEKGLIMGLVEHAWFAGSK